MIRKIAHSTPARPGFLGWTGTSAITGTVISASGGAFNFPLVDHVYTGAAPVPEPMTVTGLALGALALLRRRRRRKKA